MKIAWAKRIGKSTQIETVSRIDWADSKTIIAWTWEKERGNGELNLKVT